MKTEWTKGLPKADADALKASIRRSDVTIDRLRFLIEGRIKNSYTALKDYDTPSWSNKQAHLNGRNEAYRAILNLIDFKDNQVE